MKPLFHLLLCIFAVLHNYDSLTQDSISPIRQSWGDFNENEHIKTKPAEFSHTPVAKIIYKKGSLKDEFAYVDSIDIRKMVYESDGLMVTGFVVKPKAPGKYPCVIFNRGGNRDYGQLVLATAVIQMGEIASQGYVVIASNYRGNSGSEGQEEFGGADVNDVLNLIPALSQIEEADTSKIGMLGISRGGMMTYMALRETDRIKAAAVIGGMADLFNMKEFHDGIEERVYAELIPNYEDSMDVELEKRSAVYWAEEISSETKILMLHGENDSHVSVEEARLLHQKLTEANHDHEYFEFEKDNHGIVKHREEVNALIEEWFLEHLKK